MALQTVAAARKEKRRRERLRKKAQEAANRAARYLTKLLGEEVKADDTAWQPKAPVLFEWGLWRFVFDDVLYGYHPKHGWYRFKDKYGSGISDWPLKRAGFKLGEAGTNV